VVLAVSRRFAERHGSGLSAPAVTVVREGDRPAARGTTIISTVPFDLACPPRPSHHGREELSFLRRDAWSSRRVHFLTSPGVNPQGRPGRRRSLRRQPPDEGAV
jgi:hypothetical protein